MGTVLLHVNYDEKDRGGKPYHLEHYLCASEPASLGVTGIYLVFKKQGTERLLIHHQNTKIVPKK